MPLFWRKLQPRSLSIDQGPEQHQEATTSRRILTKVSTMNLLEPEAAARSQFPPRISSLNKLAPVPLPTWPASHDLQADSAEPPAMASMPTRLAANDKGLDMVAPGTDSAGQGAGPDAPMACEDENHGHGTQGLFCLFALETLLLASLSPPVKIPSHHLVSHHRLPKPSCQTFLLFALSSSLAFIYMPHRYALHFTNYSLVEAQRLIIYNPQI